MMETVLNVGLTSKTVKALIKKSGNPRFVYDSYRRLIMMYTDVVMEKGLGLGKKRGIRNKMEAMLEKIKQKNGYKNDGEVSSESWKILIEQYLRVTKKHFGAEFPDNHHDQLYGAIEAVFTSWNGKRAKEYRAFEKISNKLGTAVNVQAMVFGNMGEGCGTGVAFTRNPSNGKNRFYGEWLPNAQGEDVVAGIRTPQPISVDGGIKRFSLEATMPKAYKQLLGVRKALEAHFKDMQDVEFTIENNRLWMLQTRVGKRTGVAAVKIATDMVRERLINKKEAVSRVKPSQVYESMLKNIRAKDLSSAVRLGGGLPAGPGASAGQVVFCAEKAEKLGKKGKQIILVRNETSPEDIHGMRYAAGILTSRGGLTSHAALVARGWGKSCIVGYQGLKISKNKKSAAFGDKRVEEGDWITLNGTDGSIFDQKLDLFQQPIKDSKALRLLLRWADRYRRLKVRTNADTPEDCKQAVEFGAQGLGLCRTEHMFFDEKRIHQFRKMILAEKKETRIKHLKKLLPHQKKDFYNILKTMKGFPVTIRLLDPPLHEFIGVNNKELERLSKDLGKSKKNIEARINELREDNPMLGHRGCRLGISYPEITEMQAEAILGAALKLKKEKGRPKVEIMVPLVGNLNEFLDQKNIILETYRRLSKESGQTLGYKIGTMIEVPRACFSAKEIAKNADFFSFGTNDLTQTVFGFSRDDVGTFFQTYFEKEILSFDPVETISEESVGALMKMAVKDGKKGNPKLSFGICGEHGGDPKSIDFCSALGLDYVSCSPFRVPVARLAAAQAKIKETQNSG
jgi:pyruvate,orthophosphate dikinase